MNASTALRPPKPRLRGVSHLWAFIAWIPTSIALLVTAPAGVARFSALIYALGVGAMLGVSAAYHRVGWSPAMHVLLGRLDHSTIFLAIAGTYTPVALIVLSGWTQVAILVVAWGGAVVGIALQWLPVRPPRWLFTAVYALVGWAAVLALPQLWTGLGPAGFFLILGGGLFYTLGAVVYALKKPDPWPLTFGYHEVFHACTIVALLLHLAAIAFFVLPDG